MADRDFLRVELEEFSDQWSRKVAALLKGNLNSNKKSGLLIRSLRRKLRKKQRKLFAISFSFQRHGIFLEKGVAGKVATTPRPWFNPVIEQEIGELADEVSFLYDQEISNSIFIK